MKKNQKHLEKLGEDLLEQNIEEEDRVFSSTYTDSSSDNPNSLYLNTIMLSKFMTDNGFSKSKSPTINANQQNQILVYIKKIIDDLEETSNGPTVQIGPGSTILQAYRVVTFAFLAIEGKNQQTHQKYKDLKAEHEALQGKYDSFISTSEIDDKSSYEAEKLMYESNKQALQARVDELEAQIKIDLQRQKELDDLVRTLQLQLTNQRSQSVSSSSSINNQNSTPSTMSFTSSTSNFYNGDDNIDYYKKQFVELTKENERLRQMLEATSSDDLSSLVNAERNMNETLMKQSAKIQQELLDEREQKEQLLSEIERLKQESISFRADATTNDHTVEELSKQVKTLKSELLKYTNGDNTNSARIFVLETDLEAANLKCKDLQEQNQSKREKNKALHSAIRQLKEEQKQKQNEFDELQMKYDKLRLEADDFAHKLAVSNAETSSKNEIASLSAENQKLYTALNALQEEYNNVKDDLSQESAFKYKLNFLLQKQNSLLIETEQQISELTKECEEKEKKITEIQAENSKLNKDSSEKECEYSEIIQSLKQVVKTSLPQGDYSNHLALLLSDENEPLDVIKDFVAFILQHELKLTDNSNTEKNETDPSIEAFTEQNERLIIYISNLIRFIDQVANSTDIQDWLIDASQPIDIRSRLISQVRKVESFLTSTGIATNEEKLCDTYAHFPSYIMKLLEENEIFQLSMQNQEYISIIEQFALANDIITKYSQVLMQRGVSVMEDMKRMKNELTKMDQTIENRVEDETFDMREKLNSLKAEKKDLKKKILLVQKELRKSCSDSNCSNTVIKCLNIINGQEEEEEEEDNYNNEEEDSYYDNESIDESDSEKNTKSYIRKLEKQLNKAITHNEKEKKKYEKLIKELQSQILELEKSIEEGQDGLEFNKRDILSQKDALGEQVRELLENKCILESQLKDIQQDNLQLKQALEEQNQQIGNYGEIRQKELESLKKGYEAQNAENTKQLQEEIERLKKIIEDKEEENKEAINEIRQNAKDEIKKVKNEMEIQEKRTDEVKNHYEPILADLRNKLNEARQSETTARDDLLKSSAEIKDMKSQLATTVVDNKMLKMKLNATEEKLKREKSLIDTQYKMKMLQLETDHQSNVEQVKQQLITKQHQFLVQVCEKFKDYLDFSQAINEESVNQLLDKISEIISKSAQKTSDLERFYNEINQIKTILHAETSDSLIQPITELVESYNELKGEKSQIEADKAEATKLLKNARKAVNSVNTAKEWEDWARRLYSIITDNFSTLKNANELRFSLEEALMSSIGQRQLWRRIDILRCEKAIFLSGMLRASSNSRRKPTLTSLLAVVVPILRLQKLSGHLKCSVSIPKVDESQKSTKRSDKGNHKKKWPILTTY